MTNVANISPEACEAMAARFEEIAETAGGEVIARFILDDAAAQIRALRAALTASEKQLAIANTLWRLCVKEDFPWADGSTQDALREIGLLYPKDMTDEDESERCKNCDDDCETCWRAVDQIQDVENSNE